MQEGGLLKKVCDLAALLIKLCGVEDTELGLFCQVLTDGVDREHNLLHAAILTNYLM